MNKRQFKMWSEVYKRTDLARDIGELEPRLGFISRKLGVVHNSLCMVVYAQ